MKTVVFFFAIFALAAAPYGAIEISIGNATGYPGEEVSVPVDISPENQYGGFNFAFEYNDNFLDFQGFSLSNAAEYNKIDVEFEESWGEVEIDAGGYVTGGGENFGRAGSLKFMIASNAPLGTTFDIETLGDGSYDLIGGGGGHAFTSDGSIKVERDPDAVPTGPRPELDLSMRWTDVLTYGEPPIVRFELTLKEDEGQEWLGWPADAYLAVALPDGRFFYVDSHLRLTTKRTTIKKDLLIDNLKGNIGFSALSPEAPLGLYTFYGVLTFSGANPLKDSDENRITNLDTTEFDLVLPTPTPTPGP